MLLQGKFLLSSSAADTSMILWSPASETKIPLRRVGGGGVHLVSWSPSHSHAVMAATPSTVFRVWETRTWTHERWNVLEGFLPKQSHKVFRTFVHGNMFWTGYIKTCCWSPCGRYLLFCTSAEPIIFCLDFLGSSTSGTNAIPVADVSAVSYEAPNGAEIP